jgi:hypothetical protein
MISVRWVIAVAVFCPAIALVGCSGSNTGPSSSGNATTTTSVVPASPSPAPTDAAGLAALLRKGLSSVNSLHLTLNVTAGNQVIKGEGDTKLAEGTLQALDISEEVGSAGRVRLIVVDAKTYVQLPATLNQSGKPWVLVSRDSSNPTVRTMATLIESVQNAASPGQITAFTSAARRVTLVGNESLDGTRVNHYSIDVDVAKLPNTMPGRQTLLGAGLTSLPVELYVDGEGRPVKVMQDLTLRGQRSATVITLSKFNEPVSISAPPADQVATS